MNLNDIDKEIHNCNLCKDMVEKFPNSKTVSIGKITDIVILGEAPANNGWRKSGRAWYDVNDQLLPSGVVMQKLLDILDIKLEDTYVVACYDDDTKDIRLFSYNLIPCRMAGTGDIFSSIFISNILNGKDIFFSTKKAMNIVYKLIDLNKDNQDKSLGINVEEYSEAFYNE
jgi:hypothetical protein